MLNKPTLLASQRLAMFLAQTLALALVQQYHILGTLPRVILALGAFGGQGRGCPKS